MHRVLSLADNRSQLEPVLASMRQLAQQVQQNGEAPKQQFQSLESKVSVLEGSILSAGASLFCSSGFSSNATHVLADEHCCGWQLCSCFGDPRLFLSYKTEGGVCGTGSRVQAAAKVMETAALQTNSAIGQKLDSTAGSLRGLIAQQHQAIDHNLNANMQQLNGSVQACSYHHRVEPQCLVLRTITAHPVWHPARVLGVGRFLDSD